MMAKNFRIFALAYLLLVITLHLGNALKMMVLGSPVMPDDFVAMRNMLMLFEGWKFVGMVLMVVVLYFDLIKNVPSDLLPGSGN